MNLTKNVHLICLILVLGFLSLGATKEKNKTDNSSAAKQTKKSEPVSQKQASPAGFKKSLVVTPDQQVENAEKINDELKQIISRTQQLQTQVHDDRSEIQKILERAQIHQRILKGITIPQPIQSKQQINQADIIAREKMRLIAQQVHQTQEQLRAIQNSRLISSIPKTESAKTS